MVAEGDDRYPHASHGELESRGLCDRDVFRVIKTEGAEVRNSPIG